MFNDPIHVNQERLGVIEHDLAILNELQDEELPVYREWDLLRRLESDTTRYYAVKEFLENRFGKVTVDEITTTRVNFSMNGNRLSLPRGDDAVNEIYVHIADLFDPTEQLNRPAPAQADDNEHFVDSYLALMENGGSFAERARLRYPCLADCSDWECVLYYCFIIFPKDLFSGKTSIEYWKKLQLEVRRQRVSREEAALRKWVRIKERVKDFYFTSYPLLTDFHMPVILGENDKRIHIEKSIAIIENRAS